jgi:mycothiol synthase
MESVDPATAADADWARIYALITTYRVQIAPAEPVRPFADFRSQLTHTPPSAKRAAWLVRAPSGEVGAFAWVVVHGETSAYVPDLVVAPECRRRGLGRELVGQARAYAIELGCRTFGGSVLADEGRAFAAAVGARESNRSRRSLWRPPLIGDAPALAGGYALRSWTGPAPGEILESYALARNAINDAPHDAEVDPEPWTPDLVRELEDALARRGRQIRVTVALAPDGSVAGFTELRVSPEPGAAVFTEDTAVCAEHRGRGVAQAIKHESLRRLLVDRPDIDHVSTSNDVTNAAMIAINTKMGFVQTVIWTHVIMSLTEAA